MLLYVQYVYESKYVFECMKPKTFSKDLYKYRITKFDVTLNCIVEGNPRPVVFLETS